MTTSYGAGDKTENVILKEPKRQKNLGPPFTRT